MPLITYKPTHSEVNMNYPSGTTMHLDTTHELYSYITDLGEYSTPHSTVRNETLVELTDWFERDGVKLFISSKDGFYKFTL